MSLLTQKEIDEIEQETVGCDCEACSDILRLIAHIRAAQAMSPNQGGSFEDLLNVPYTEDSTGIRHVQVSVVFYEERIREAFRRGAFPKGES